MVDGVLSTGGDNTYRTHALTETQFVYDIEFIFSNSGAIDNLVLETVTNMSEIPAPASLPVMALSVATLAYMKRRQRKGVAKATS